MKIKLYYDEDREDKEVASFEESLLDLARKTHDSSSEPTSESATETTPEARGTSSDTADVTNEPQVYLKSAESKESVREQVESDSAEDSKSHKKSKAKKQKGAKEKRAKSKKGFFGKKDKDKDETSDTGSSESEGSYSEAEEDSEEAQDKVISQRLFKLKVKKALFATALVGFLVTNTVVGVYNAFFKEPPSYFEIAANVNRLNGYTPFPEVGVLSYLNKNADTLFQKNATLRKGAREAKIAPGSVNLTEVVEKDAFTANVYFSADVETALGRNTHNFFLSLGFDWDEGVYYPMSELQLSVNNYPVVTKVTEESPYLTFKDLERDAANEQSARTFVNNFFIMLFNEEADISTFYSGDRVIGDENARFEKIEDFKLYTQRNRNGYNAVVTYYLALDEGVTYKVTNYLDLVNEGGHWVVKSIL